MVITMYPLRNPSHPNRTSTLPFPGTLIMVYEPSSQAYVYRREHFWKFRTLSPFKRYIMYAQDEQKRDVTIKLVQTDSVEHRIHQCLMSYTEFNRLELFPFIIPTLETLPSPHNFLFVIMPRWVSFCLLINGFHSFCLVAAGVLLRMCLTFAMLVNCWAS
jgi:hypothetical protein